VGPGLDFRAGFGDRRFTFLAPRNLLRNREPVLQRRGVGLLGFSHELCDLQFQLGNLLAGASVAHGGMLAGVGGDLRAVDAHRHLAELGQFQLLGQLENLDETLGHQGFVRRPESANRRVVRMSVAGDEPHGHVVIGGLLDPAGTEGAGRITVDQEAQQHRRRILFAAGAAGIDLDLAQVERFDCIDDEVREMVGRDPIPQVGRQQHGGTPVDGNKARSHTSVTAYRPPSSAGPRKCHRHFHLAAHRAGPCARPRRAK